MQIGILETGKLPDDLAARHGAYPDMFASMLAGQGFKFSSYEIVGNQFPASPHEQQGWIITGSRHAAYEDHAWISPLESLIRDAVEAAIPMVGICFGHQIMAQALGGRVAWLGGQWGVGLQHYNEAEDKTAQLLAMHQDQVVEKPPQAEIIMHSGFCPIAGLSYQGKAISYQPHPEFSKELVRDLIELRRGEKISEDQAEPALENLTDPVDAPRIADEIARFLKTAAARTAA